MHPASACWALGPLGWVAACRRYPWRSLARGAASAPATASAVPSNQTTSRHGAGEPSGGAALPLSTAAAWHDVLLAAGEPAASRRPRLLPGSMWHCRWRQQRLHVPQELLLACCCLGRQHNALPCFMHRCQRMSSCVIARHSAGATMLLASWAAAASPNPTSPLPAEWRLASAGCALWREPLPPAASRQPTRAACGAVSGLIRAAHVCWPRSLPAVCRWLLAACVAGAVTCDTCLAAGCWLSCTLTRGH